MERILRIDRQLDRLYASFRQIAETLPFETLGLLHEIDIAQYRNAGIYLIEMKVPSRFVNLPRWLQRFRADFDKPEHRQS
jgi:hypothetical protein